MSDRKNCTGCFLVASPYLTDGHFFRAAVLIIRHEQEGAFGVVINRPTDKRFSDLIAMSDPSWSGKSGAGKGLASAGSHHPIWPADAVREDAGDESAGGVGDDGSANGSGTPDAIARDQIFRGGPVGGPLMVLHDIAGIGEPCGPLAPGEAGSADGAGGGAKSFPDGAGQTEGAGPTEGAGDEDDDSLADPMTPSSKPGETTSGGPGISATWHNYPADPHGSLEIQWLDVPAWVTADEDHLRLLARREDARLKFVVDYAGWGRGQLEQELAAGGWLVLPAKADDVFASDDELWQRLVHRCGSEIMEELTPELRRRRPGASFDAGCN